MKGLLEAVQQKKGTLKPTQAFDRSQPDLQLIKKDSQYLEEYDKRREYYFQSTIDQWYENIQDSTFETVVEPISRQECFKIVLSCKEILSKNDDALIKIPDGLKDLEDRIDNIIRHRFSSKYPAVFVKLSTRSPKDSKTLFRKAEEAFYKRPDIVNNFENLSYNSRLIAFYEEIARANAVSTGREALSLLLDSWRIADDIMYALGVESYSEIENYESRNEVKEYPISLVIRGYNPKVLPHTEFRGFIWNHQLTCLGQYHHALYYPEKIALQKDVIIADCQDFVRSKLLCRGNLSESTTSSLPIPHAMLDLVWLGPGEVFLVEINPLMEGLSSFQGSMGLFDFYKDNDLITGRMLNSNSLEFRMRTEEESREEMLGHLPPEWKRVIIG